MRWPYRRLKTTREEIWRIMPGSYIHMQRNQNIWPDDAYIVGEICTLLDLEVSDSLLRKDLFP